MIFQRVTFFTFLACMSFAMSILSVSSLANAEQKNTIIKHHAATNILSGKVTDIIKVPNYTYAEVNIGKKKVWVAGPVTPLKNGDKISFSAGMPMKNFHSKSMKRDFPVVYFVGQFITANGTISGKPTSMPSSHAQIKYKKVSKPVAGIKKVDDGYSISEIYTDKEKLKGKSLRVRGKVTKFTAEVMGKNWIHIRDSSTLDDLTITTKDTVAVDDIVVVEGNLELNKDFNYGYVYPVILLDANVVK